MRSSHSLSWVTAYVCGNKPVGAAICFALGRDADAPLWSLELQPSEEHQCKGGAVAPGRLYVTLHEGRLVAIGEEEIAVNQSASCGFSFSQTSI